MQAISKRSHGYALFHTYTWASFIKGPLATSYQLCPPCFVMYRHVRQLITKLCALGDHAPRMMATTEDVIPGRSTYGIVRITGSANLPRKPLQSLGRPVCWVGGGGACEIVSYSLHRKMEPHAPKAPVDFEVISFTLLAIEGAQHHRG